MWLIDGKTATDLQQYLSGFSVGTSDFGTDLASRRLPRSMPRACSHGWRSETRMACMVQSRALLAQAIQL